MSHMGKSLTCIFSSTSVIIDDITGGITITGLSSHLAIFHLNGECTAALFELQQ
jgi:hypothetical protein